MKKTVLMLSMLLFVLISGNLFAQRDSDIDGSKDYPLVPRFDGSYIEFYKVNKAAKLQIPFNFKSKSFTFKYPATISGELYRIQYSASADYKPDVIIEKLKAQLEAKGFEIDFAKASQQNIGMTAQLFFNEYYKKLGAEKFGYSYVPESDENGLLIAHKNEDGKDIYTLIYVSWFSNANLITEDVMEAGSFEQNAPEGDPINLISPFKDSWLVWYQSKNFDRYFVLSKEENKINNYEIDGSIFRMQYYAPKEHSVFEISSSYENALKKAGYEILLSLDQKNTNLNLSEQLYIGEFNGLNALPRGAEKPGFREEFAYFAAKKHIGNNDVYVVGYIVYWNKPLITLDIIEVQAMEDDLVTAKSLSEKIDAEGHLALAGIYFETGKATLSDKSKSALTNIAEYLKSHTDQKYFIVGHTDNTGDFAANKSLSEERAKAVMNALVNDYGVDDGQLQAYGVASLNPVTSNSTKEGRAQNRRVEIVLQ
jgi:outer membrane protein OmpA-like peptidoglycan-associated protein